MITSFFVLLVGVCIEVCVLEGFKCIVWRMLKLPMVRLLIHTFITDFLRREKETGPESPPLSGHHQNLGEPGGTWRCKIDESGP